MLSVKSESLSFIFNADLGDRKFVRSWTWLPKTDEVILHGETDAENTTYKRGELEPDGAGKLAEIDSQFVNDLYWLIFPMQVAWDSSVTIEALPDEAASVFPECLCRAARALPGGRRIHSW